MGGSIGDTDTDTWKPYTNATREEHAKLVTAYISSLPTTLKEENRHSKMLEYMAQNGIRQLGPPRIGIFAERQRPEPLHCEINAWQQVLSIIYLESVQRERFSDFIEVIGAPVSLKTTAADESQSETDESSTSETSTSQSQTIGCGLRYLVSKVKEHHDDKNRRHNKVRTRLIGPQATALAHYAIA
jgi:hypothetical protein